MRYHDNGYGYNIILHFDLEAIHSNSMSKPFKREITSGTENIVFLRKLLFGSIS